MWAGGSNILHADLDAFFASVEQRDDPRLRGRPVVVGGGVVLAASYEAKACGVRAAMGAAALRRLCPHAVVVPPRFAAYSAASRAVFEIFADTTPLVENVSIDEAFLDVAGLRRLSGPPEAIGARLRARVRQEVGLPITVGIARTRFLAKVAGRIAKPDGLLLVPPDREREFLDPLPIAVLWGIGEATASRLTARGITTWGDAAALPTDVLAAIVGAAAARRLRAVAGGQDSGRLRSGPRRRSIGSQTALGRRPRDAGQIDAILLAVVDRVMHRVRAAGCVGRTVVLRLRFDDYAAVTRSRALSTSTAHTATVLAVARALLAAARPMIEQRGLTLLGLALADVDRDTAVQLVLPWAAGGAADGDVQAATDAVRARFGSDALRPATLLGGRRG
ncbi:MAG TPA: DNA polymerase IV [Sporichthyaceae bacterium]|jgi:DNA polymerase-4|nr:DNA polymerase IV [Sporichthyaceae bacterium]